MGQLSLACKDLQEGTNYIELYLSEQQNITNNFNAAKREEGLTTFQFFSDTIDKGAYSIILDVTETCNITDIGNKTIDVGVEGKLLMRSQSQESLQSLLE